MFCHHVAEVLQKLRKFHLYLKEEKYQFHQSKIQFLIYNISQHGAFMDKKKVLNCPTPTTVK